MEILEHRGGMYRSGAYTTNYAERCIRDLLQTVDITVDGPGPSDIQVRDPGFYIRVLRDGALGLGESYMDGWWDCEDLPDMIARIARGDLDQRVAASWPVRWAGLRARLLNLQSGSRSQLIAQDHYDRTLAAYRCMTDSRTTLSCGYWNSAETLEQAQVAKLDLICRKLSIVASDRVLDIGCGFGSFAHYAAEKYGCSIVGINISPQQADEARMRCVGLPVRIVTCDYRDTSAYLHHGKFDKIVSVGMFEHVGYKNYRTYFQTIQDCLKQDGLFLLHTIGSNVSRVQNDPWFDKYIFPNGLLPSIRQIGGAIEGLFVMEDWHNFGHDYVRTLMSWHDNFERNWIGSRSDPFYRMWSYYLLSGAGWFKSRRAQLWQLVMSTSGVAGGYAGVR